MKTAARHPAVDEPGAPPTPVSLLGYQIQSRLRAEFQALVIVAPVGHPVLGVAACAVPDCRRGRKSGSLCGAHGNRWYRAGRPVLQGWAEAADPWVGGSRPNSRCTVAGCHRGGATSDLCGSHYQAWKRAGRPDPTQWVAGRITEHGESPECAVNGCDLQAETPRRPLCRAHQARWRRNARPPIAEFCIEIASRGEDVFDLRELPASLRLEVQYGLQCRVDENRVKTQAQRLAPLIRYLAASESGSLRQKSMADWRRDLAAAKGIGWPDTAVSFVRQTLECLEDLQSGVGWESEYPRDVWRLRHLGFPPARIATLRFDRLNPPWLRELAKRWLRWRLSTGISLTQAGKDLGALTRFAAFLADVEPDLPGAAALDREMLERFLAWLAATRPHAKSRGGEIGGLAAFLRALHQHRWAPELPVSAAFYSEDYPRQPAAQARALSEFVATQVEADYNLTRFVEPRYRLLTELLQRTGLRVGDARQLPLDCLVRDEHRTPYLRYRNHKMRREAHVPIDDALAVGIAAQQARVLERFPAGTCLFPMTYADPDGSRPVSRSAYVKHLNAWLRSCDIRDEVGRPAKVTPHQWRHTYATRLINSGVAQHVVKKLLDHDTDTMTAHYARLSLATVREQWEQATKVDVTGATVSEGSGTLADAVWLKNSLSRAKMALPNGYCTLPLQQTCEYANACLTCPMFLTTAQFLPEHRRQLQATRELVAGAQSRGQTRVVEMNRTVEINLTRIIATLEQPAAIVCGTNCKCAKAVGDES